jgi:hypothetical protein
MLSFLIHLHRFHAILDLYLSTWCPRSNLNDPVTCHSTVIKRDTTPKTTINTDTMSYFFILKAN